VYRLEAGTLEVVEHVEGPPVRLPDDVQTRVRGYDGQAKGFGCLQRVRILANGPHQADSSGQRCNGHLWWAKQMKKH